jgi:tRNA pseudouridine65 synthase
MDAANVNFTKPYSDSAPTFDILHQEESFIAIHKPEGFHVHQPEDPRGRVSRDLICMNNLRNQIDKYVWPVHRIDVGTDGVLLFALNKPSASNLARQFQDGSVRKTYFAVVRGWPDDEGTIDVPLELDSTNELVDALTKYRTHARIELPFAVGKRHKSARYALVEAHPHTGRFHQVRRHMARLSHPLLGDIMHGDSHHNRFFRTELELPGLWLKAKSANFLNPSTGARVHIESKWSGRWLALFAKLGIEAPPESPTNV